MLGIRDDVRKLVRTTTLLDNIIGLIRSSTQYGVAYDVNTGLGEPDTEEIWYNRIEDRDKTYTHICQERDKHLKDTRAIGNHFTKLEFFGKGSVPEKTWLLVKEMETSFFIHCGFKVKGIGRSLYTRGTAAIISNGLYNRRNK